MTEILGTIDNASLQKEFYHLVFTPTEVVLCRVMDKAEFKAAARGMDPLLQAFIASYMPIEGHPMEKYSLFQAQEAIFSMNKARGGEIEKNLDAYLGDNHGKVRSLDYADISSIVLIDGAKGTAPHLLINSMKEKFKFRLSGAVLGFSTDGAVYSDGSDNFLREIFGSRFMLK